MRPPVLVLPACEYLDFVDAGVVTGTWLVVRDSSLATEVCRLVLFADRT